MQEDKEDLLQVLPDDEKIREDLGRIRDYLAFRGYGYDPGLLENYYLALKTRPFVLLSGLSGGGKSRLARLFAEACGATPENGRYLMIPVRPDWADPTDLWGHCDLEGRFIPGILLPFMKKATSDPDNLYFLTLDEMNLSRTEYYLSDLLSVFETRRHEGGQTVSDPLFSPALFGRDQEALSRFGGLTLPCNLMITGCINMDESTYSISRRVLDRVWVLEIMPTDLTPPRKPEVCPEKVCPGADWLKGDYFTLSDLPIGYETLTAALAPFQQINNLLAAYDRPMGFRTRDELLFFLTYNRRFALLTNREATDLALLEKLLPRLSGPNLKPLLCELFRFFVGNCGALDIESADLTRDMARILSAPGCRYPKSAAKILWMIRRCQEDGFTSYWI